MFQGPISVVDTTFAEEICQGLFQTTEIHRDRFMARFNVYWVHRSDLWREFAMGGVEALRRHLAVVEQTGSPMIMEEKSLRIREEAVEMQKQELQRSLRLREEALELQKQEVQMMVDALKVRAARLGKREAGVTKRMEDGLQAERRELEDLAGSLKIREEELDQRESFLQEREKRVARVERELDCLLGDGEDQGCLASEGQLGDCEVKEWPLMAFVHRWTEAYSDLKAMHSVLTESSLSGVPPMEVSVDPVLGAGVDVPVVGVARKGAAQSWRKWRDEFIGKKHD